MKNFRIVFFVLLATLVMSGCGGSNNNNNSTTTIPTGVNNTLGAVTYGSLTTRATGTLQAPVVLNGTGTSVTGVAGAGISSLIQTVPISKTVPAALISGKIIFTRYDGSHNQIYTVNPINGESVLQQITNGAQDSSNPALSPDGTRIAFHRSDGTHNQIYTVTVAGGEGTLQQITNNALQDSVNPVFSPDGSRILFFRSDGNRYQIYTISSSGINNGAAETSLQQITTSTTQGSYAPTYSPDGSKIAFFRNDGVSQYQIYTISATGGEGTLQKITNSSSQGSFSPTFTPDGSKIAFQRYDGSRYQIYTETLTGGEPSLQLITNGTQDSLYPFYSPDGTKIAFQRYDGTNRNQIYTVSAAGGESSVVQITNSTAQNSNFPKWGNIAQANLVGVGGTLGASAAGFVFSQTGSATNAVLTFDTATPLTEAGARVTPVSGIANTTSAPLLLEVTAPDALARLAYQNNGSTVQTPIASTGSANGAVVYFKNSDGTITTVLPFTTSATIAAPTATKNQDGTITLQGRFLGNFDANGNNSAPSGTSSVTLPAQ